MKVQTYREDNIKMAFKQVVYDGVEWDYQEQNSGKLRDLVNTEMNLCVHKIRRIS